MKILSKYKGELKFTLANMIQSCISMLMGVVATACISPSDFGVYNSILLISTYASFLQLGIFNGLNRNLAYYKAQGNILKMQKSIDTSHTVSVITALIGGIIGLAVFIYFLYLGKSGIYLWSCLALIIMLIFQPLVNHLENTFRSGQEFGRLGTIKNVQSAIFSVFSILPLFWGLIGKVIADCVLRLLSYTLLIKRPPYPHKSRGDWATWKELFAVGLPLLVAGYIWQIFVVSDKTFIATHMPSEAMGLYTIAGYVIALFSVLPTALNSLLYPKAATRYGATGDKTCLLPFWKKSIILFSSVLIPLAILAYTLIPWGVNTFLPKYEGGIEVARISLLTCLTFISMGPSVIFGTLKKNKGYIFAVFSCWSAFWLIIKAFPSFFTTIESVAYLRFALSLILMLYIIIHTYLLIKK